MMHHIYNSTAPTYFCDLIGFSSTRCLRSTTRGAAAVQRTRTRLGDRFVSSDRFELLPQKNHFITSYHVVKLYYSTYTALILSYF